MINQSGYKHCAPNSTLLPEGTAMSLLSTLLRAGSELHTALEKRPPAPSVSTGSRAQGNAELTAQPGADRFTPSESKEDDSTRKVSKLAITDYKKSVGQDLAFIRETLRHKLAEYNMPPATAIHIKNDRQGNIAVEGKGQNPAFARIAGDLNVNTAFQDAFRRMSVNEPTLHFMDNALKLGKAYGVNNSLLNTLVSENQQFNGLQDLVHRYDSLRRNAEAVSVASANTARDYALSFNARA
ncbi:MAG: hypothetical protein ACI8SG_000834 [Marinobacter psychrophilus]